MKRTLVIDVGGTHVKLLSTGRRSMRRVDSGQALTPRRMARDVLEAVSDWSYDRVSIGIPAPIRDHRPMREPVNLGRGWVKFDYERAFGCPVRMVNDAAMQAIGSYEGGRMLFMGLGTGLGTCVIIDGAVVPLELAHLPYRHGRSFEDYLGDAGRREAGKRRWAEHVVEVTEMLRAATVSDYVVLGGGNVRLLRTLPPHGRRGDNANAFRGGYRLWTETITWR